MYNWSVLNDSIQDFLEMSTSFQNNIHWYIMKLEIDNIMQQLSGVRNHEDLYALASMHQKWHGAVINRIFFSALNDLRNNFGDFYINMLMEVFSEAAYISQDDRHHKEVAYAKMLEGGFADIFPELTHIKREAVFDRYRIDLLAQEPHSGRDVLFELKLGADNPTPQLLEYAGFFRKPILIGVTEKHLPERQKHSNVYYFTYADLNRKAIANVRKKFGETKQPFPYCQSEFDQEFESAQNTLD